MYTEQTEQINLGLEEEVPLGACGQDPSAQLGMGTISCPRHLPVGSVSSPHLKMKLPQRQVKCLKVSLKRFKVILGCTRNSRRVAGLHETPNKIKPGIVTHCCNPSTPE